MWGVKHVTSWATHSFGAFATVTLYRKLFEDFVIFERVHEIT